MSGRNVPEVAARIRRVLIESLSLEMDEGEISYAEKLDEVTGLDSMAVLEFLAALEKEFGVVLDPEHLELDSLKDLNRLAAIIGEQTGQ